MLAVEEPRSGKGSGDKEGPLKPAEFHLFSRQRSK